MQIMHIKLTGVDNRIKTFWRKYYVIKRQLKTAVQKTLRDKTH